MPTTPRETALAAVAASGRLRGAERRTDGREIVGRAMVEGAEVEVGVRFGPGFPEVLPTVHLYPWDALGLLPHVLPPERPGGSGFVCYLDMEGTILDRRNPGGLAVEALDRALDLLAEGARGDNVGEFAEEWETYWGQVSRGTPLLLVGDAPQRAGTLTVFEAAPNTPLLLARDEAAARSFTGQTSALKAAQTVIYVPLRPGSSPTPPHLHGPAWTGSDVRALLRTCAAAEDVRRAQKKGRRLRARFTHRSRETVVFSLPKSGGGLSFFAVEFDGVRGPHPLLKGRYDAVRHVHVERFDRGFLVPRGGGDGALSRARALVIGCGAVGGRVAVELARSGVLRLTLVDPDVMRMANVFRHVLGRTAFGLNKAQAMKARLEMDLPYVESRAVPATIETALSEGTVRFADYDLVVFATGHPTSELALNERLWATTGGPAVVYAWVEPYGIGGHALLMRPGQPGCLECLYTSSDLEAPALANRAAFAAAPPTGRTYGKALSGCGSLFTPYGSVDAAQSALAAVRLGVGALTGAVDGNPLVSWTGDAAAFEAEGFSVTTRHGRSADALAAERLDYVASGCPVCGNTS